MNEFFSESKYFLPSIQLCYLVTTKVRVESYGKEKKNIAPHGCEPLKLTVTNKTTACLRIPIFDTLS